MTGRAIPRTSRTTPNFLDNTMRVGTTKSAAGAASMATAAEPVALNFPDLPSRHDQFIPYVAANPKKPMLELLEPFKQYDAELRKAFAQQPDHPAAKQPNVLPLFAGHEKHVTVRARDPKAETQQERECYIMPLKSEDRKADGSPAIVQSFKEFQTNFNVFSESSLADLDWSNVVVAGSAVASCLMSVPEKHSESKRALRQYYHEKLAPASDVDLFLYGLTEEQAIEKIKQIERNVRDALLVETTTVRTKNAISIASKHPVRHVQIVLRIYKSISEILTGFDVDCSCAAYDGKQVYVSPRALVSYMTQINTVDLTRRSPSYENRLSKYAHRGFEVYWPNLDRSRIDPTIFERSFGRTEGLARLLILEKLPKSEDRDSYLDQRRRERGRPAANRFRNRMLYGNIKDEHEDEVAEWVDAEVSDYHTITVPYGPKFHARKIEKLLYTKDMLLNAEWNKPKDREVNLHRHPAFFGSAEDVIGDCCGYCPEPSTVEEEEAHEEESKKFVKGRLAFMKDDPGRQAIGSFNPIDAEGWTEMAYVGNTALLCQAIVDEDVEYVKTWLQQEGNDPNTRDYTGRTPLHLAVTNSSPEVVQTLIDHGARMVARLVDGRTALHLAAMRGNVEIVSALLKKSAANEEEAEEKVDARRAARKAAKKGKIGDIAMDDADKEKASSHSAEEDSDVEMIEGSDADTNINDATTEGSMVDIRKPKQESEDALLDDEGADDPDVFDVNVVAWDTASSPLHLAIAQGHIDVVKCLVQEFGADVLLPIKIFNDYDKSARAAILTLVLAMQLGFEKAQEMVKILISLGASSAQADVEHRTAFQYCVADRPDLVDTLATLDASGVKRAINHLAGGGHINLPDVTSPLITAIRAKDTTTAIRLLVSGAKSEIDFSAYVKAVTLRHKLESWSSQRNLELFHEDINQPIISAIEAELPELAIKMVADHGIDVNTISKQGWKVLNNEYRRRDQIGTTVLDVVREKLKALRDWTPNGKDAPKSPGPVKDDAEYLAEFKEGTYAYFTAKKQVESARRKYERDMEQYEKKFGKFQTQESKKCVDEKQQAINELISAFEELEKTLVARGAKGFYELHVEIKEPTPYSQRYSRPSLRTLEEKKFAISFDFKLGDLTDETRERYVQLFEAAWAGDLVTVKELTLTPWKNAAGEDQPPLKIAVQDYDFLTPFAIAVAQGHQDVAKAMMEIAQAQLTTNDPAKKRRYGIEDDEDAEDSDGSSDGSVQLYSEVVEDEFTREDVGAVSLQAKSNVSPLQMLLWGDDLSHWAKEPAPLQEKTQTKSHGFSYFGPRKPHPLANKRTNTGSIKLPPDTISENYEGKTIGKPRSLIQLAMHNNDPTLLNWVLNLWYEYNLKDRSIAEDLRTSFYRLQYDDSRYAFEVGRPHLLAELVKHGAAGVHLPELCEKYGIAMREKSNVYQGLQVRGKRRKDWAKGRTGIATSQSPQTPPLLKAIQQSSLELVEWWLSDAPLRCYREFAEANKDDKQVSRLTQSSTGFEGAVKQFLATRSHLAIHCAVLATPTVESMKVLRYVIEVMPEYLETKNQDGLTPLHVAFSSYHKGAAELLIEAGADQMCRDNSGKNLMHSLLDRNPEDEKQLEALKGMLSLIDPRLVQEMCLQTCKPLATTPLASWVSSYNTASPNNSRKQVLETILACSQSKEELRFINGEGDTPLHHAVKHSHPLIVKTLLDHDPTLLNRENATGRTPYEMAEDAKIARMCAEPPLMPEDRWRGFPEKRARRYGLPSHWFQGVLEKDEELFAEDAKKGMEASEQEQVWEILKDARERLVREGRAKRRLVTLNEANEVARRLAGMKAGRGAEDRSDAEEDERVPVRDEVQDMGSRWFWKYG